MVTLTTNNEVLQVAYGRTSALDVSASEITTAIEDAESEIFSRYTPAKRVQIIILSSRTQYEFRELELQTYSVKQVFVNSPNINPNNAINRNLVNSGSYTTDLTTNKISISSGLAGSWNGSYLEIDYYPIEWNKLAKNKAALNLIDVDMAQMNPGAGEPGSGNVMNPRVTRIAKRISRIEHDIAPVMALGSYENIGFDARDRPVVYQQRFNKTA